VQEIKGLGADVTGVT